MRAETRRRLSGPARIAVLTAAAATALAACGSSASSSGSGPVGSASGPKRPAPPQVAMAQSVGAGEGQVNLVNWDGYVVKASKAGDPDWVTPFETATGCKVNSKVAGSSDEMVTLMKTGQYDGVSASGDATLRLIYGGDVAPVNTSLVPNYATVAPFLKDRPWNSVQVDGKSQMYGIPHGWGANVLMWNQDVVKPAPDSWGAVFDPASPYKNKVTAYDSPIYIADAALYLKATKPDLKITNPYELDDTQFNAAVDLLKQQRGIVGEYWGEAAKNIDAFNRGSIVLGTTWQYNANAIGAEKKVKVGTVVPKEGSTGWSDTWMVSSKAAHPNCMYKWLDWIVSPKANAAVAEYFGEAPSQTKACDVTADKNHCTTYHALDQAYADKIAYWTTPTKDCGDDRGTVCKDYAAWTQAWTAIKG
ncbi:MAG TPA: ABC transporter substrate-binding protein [Kineosporiaceae bacterium]|nr:ABC transporter substrate-binding protein [Kineosporiaceae bacterium]